MGNNLYLEEILAACEDRLISPAIALENEEIQVAIKTGDIKTLYAALDNNF